MTEPTMTTNNESVSEEGKMGTRHSPIPWTGDDKGYIKSVNGDLLMMVLDNADTGMEHICDTTGCHNQQFMLDATNNYERLNQETKTLREQVDELTHQRDLAHKDKDVYLNATCEVVKSNSQLTLKLEQSQAENVRLQERVEAIESAARALVARMKEIYNDPLYRYIWESAANHGIDYSNGPKWENEFISLEQALATESDKEIK